MQHIKQKTEKSFLFFCFLFFLFFVFFVFLFFVFFVFCFFLFFLVLFFFSFSFGAVTRALFVGALVACMAAYADAVALARAARTWPERLRVLFEQQHAFVQ